MTETFAGIHMGAAELAAIIALALAGFLKWHFDRALKRERDLSRAREDAIAGTLMQARLLDAVAQAVLALDSDGRIAYLNRYAEKLFGWDRAEAIGQPIAELLLPPESRVQGQRALARVLEGESWSGEMAVRRKDDSVFPALAIASPIRDGDGQLRGAVVMASDLTERLRAAREQRFLAEASQVLSSSLDIETTLESVARLAVPFLADFCMVDILHDGEMKRVGSAHAQPEMQQIATTLRSFPPDPRGTSPAARVLRTGQAEVVAALMPGELEAFVTDADHLDLVKQLTPSSYMVVPISARGARAGTITFASSSDAHRYTDADLAIAEELARRAGVALEHASLYNEAQAANQAKSDFLAVVSHELRTPLTTVMGYTDLLLTGVPDPLPKTATTYVERMRKAAWHLLGLIEQILIYARMEVGRDEVHPSRVELAELTKETAGLMEPIAAEKGLRFVASGPQPPSIIETDLTKIRQILLNLLSNAIKFTDHGDVRLDVAMKDGKALFRVTDSGQGISVEHLEKIFDPFWQVEQATTRSVGGAGLGLSVSRRLARLLGGDVRVVSAPGAGSTFVVELPARYEAPTPPR